MVKTDEISDVELAQLDRSLERRHQDGSLYNELYSAGEVRALRARLRRAEGENQCDVCVGSGKPLSGGPCMCGGTGKMSVAAVWLREAWARESSARGFDPCGTGELRERELREMSEALKARCPACLGTRKILEDHDGRAGYRPCEECR